MGRQLDLERLALGRSAFQDMETEGETIDERPDHPTGSAVNDQRDGDGYKQQYDSKGRPVNPATEARNQAMRDAQNAVLTLVGVVESKETADLQLESQNCSNYEAREGMLKAEHARGDELGLITSLLHVAITWWPESLTSRIQAGVYPESMSFADIVLQDLTAAQHDGIFETLFAGVPITIIYPLLKLLLCWTMLQGFGRMQKWLNKRLQASTFKRVNHAIVVTCLFGFLAIDATLVPMQYYATLQKLGLAPARPMLLGWKSVLPRSAYSMHHFIWESTVNLPFVGLLCSPGALIWLQNVMMPIQEESLLIVGKFSTLEYLQSIERLPRVARPGLDQRSIGRFLYCRNLISARVLKWFGWNLEYIEERPRVEKEFENNYLPCRAPVPDHDAGQGSISNREDKFQHVHRSTSLSHLPAKYLADLMDEFCARLLMLPFDSIALRTIAFSFLASTLPRTPQAISLATHIYAPFGGGPLGLFRAQGFSTGTWQSVGSYMGKLGLSLALQCSVQIGAFYAVYKMTRGQGIRNFGWGCSSTNNSDRIEENVDDLDISNP